MNPYASSPGNHSSVPATTVDDFGAGIIKYFQEGARGEDFSKSFSQSLNALMPERMFSSHAANMQMTESQHHSSTAVDLLNLTLFMVSNKFFQQASDIGVQMYNLIKRRLNIGLLEYVLSASGPTAEALVECLFSLAIENDDAYTVKKILNCGFDHKELRFSNSEGSKITPLQHACSMRSLELVQALLDAGADVNSTLQGRRSPLTLAIVGPNYNEQSRDRANIELVQILLRAGANVNPGPRESPLAEAAATCDLELVTLLLSADADPNFMGRDVDSTPLSKALASEYTSFDIIPVVRLLLQAGADVNAGFCGDDKVSTALHVAVLYDSGIDLIQLLLEGGAYITEPAMTTATRECKLEIVELFLRSGARVTHEAIEAAVKAGESERFWLLLDSTEDSIKEIRRSEALTAAIRCGKKDLIDTLSASGVKPQMTYELKDAIKAAIWREDIAVLRLLLGVDSPYRASVAEYLGDSLCCAVARGRGDIIELLLAAGTNVNASGSDMSATPLWLAIQKKDAPLSQRLLAAGATVNISPCISQTVSVLPAAVAWGNRTFIQDIISAGADINAPGMIGQDTSLIVAVRKGDRAIVQLLVDAGADVNATGDTAATGFAKQLRITALVVAVWNNDLSMVHYLLALGAETTEISLVAAVSMSPELMQILLTARLSRYQRLSSGFGCRALQYAIASSNVVIMEMLLLKGVDPSTIIPHESYRDDHIFYKPEKCYMESAFGIAIRFDKSPDLWMIQMLLRWGANPNKIVSQRPNSTALLAAIYEKSLRLVKMLIDAGVDVNPKLVGGILHTPLQLAAEQGTMDIIEVLLEQGADVNASPYHQYGATALQLAAIKGYLGIASMLLEKGAEIDAPSAKVGGRTALEGAAEYGRIDMLQFLLNAGAQVTGPGSVQYQRAREFATENGHIAARRLLERYHAQQLDILNLWAMNIENVEDIDAEL